MTKFKVIEKHDHGTACIHVHATDAEAAKRVVMAAELCPERAIKEIKR